MDLWEFSADAVMVGHAVYTTFLTGGLVLAIAGVILKWAWIRRRWFVYSHLGAALLLGGRLAAGIPCPLKSAEDSLRLHSTSGCVLGSWWHASAHALAFRGMPHGDFAVRAALFIFIALAAHFGARLIVPKARHRSI